MDPLDEVDFLQQGGHLVLVVDSVQGLLIQFLNSWF